MQKVKTAYISLGSNLGDTIENTKNAISYISESVGEIVKQSSFYQTQPWGFETENLFINAMISINTNCSAEIVLEKLLEIEKKMGRQRSEISEYQSRIIDLDLIAFENLVLNTKKVVIPHPRMHLRPFVLVPFEEIEPNWRHPLINKGLRELIEEVEIQDEVRRLNV